MKFERIVKDWRTDEERVQECDFYDLMSAYADDTSCGEGQFERLESRAHNTEKMVYRLMERLVKKGLLDPFEILDEVVASWGDNDERILIDGKTLAEYRKNKRSDY